MASAVGYLKLWRSMLEWEWVGDANVVAVFVQILLRTNREAKRKNGIDIPAGSFLTSRTQLAQQCGLTEKQARRALEVLEEGRTIVKDRAGLGLLVSLVNWEKYQSSEIEKGRIRADVGADPGPNNGRKRATTKEEKKLRREEGEEVSSIEDTADRRDPNIEEVIEHFRQTFGEPDDSKRWLRIHATNLLKWIAKTYPDHDPVVSTRALISAAKEDPFHGTKAHSLAYLYRYRSTIADDARSRKSKTKNLSNDEYAKQVADKLNERFGPASTGNAA